MDPREYADRDQQELLQMVLDLGATEEEARAAAARFTLGPLALDLSTRGPGETLSLDEFAARSDIDPDMVHRMWTALGLPVEALILVGVTPRMAAALRLFHGLAMMLGEPAVLALARVMGQSVARLAEAVSDAFRVGTEVPALSAGVSYPDIVRGYTSFTQQALPFFYEAMGAVFQRHLVVVSHQLWEADDAGTTITRERTVGFADLVDSTEVLLAGSVADLAALVSGFEMLAWDVVAGAGGRVVKLIGDEAMFVFEDPAAGCAAALELSRRSAHPVRVGLAHGAVVGVHGDYTAGPSTWRPGWCGPRPRPPWWCRTQCGHARASATRARRLTSDR
ncbi:MAG: adenylate cyclase [Actinomycetota bacterium]